MFGIGFPELIVILVIALLVLGPGRLPEVAKALGKAMGEFRRATSDVAQELRDTQRMVEEEARAAERQARELQSVARSTSKSSPGRAQGTKESDADEEEDEA